jgi:hypothetical protein
MDPRVVAAPLSGGGPCERTLPQGGARRDARPDQVSTLTQDLLPRGRNFAQFFARRAGGLTVRLTATLNGSHDPRHRLHPISASAMLALAARRRSHRSRQPLSEEVGVTPPSHRTARSTLLCKLIEEPRTVMRVEMCSERSSGRRLRRRPQALSPGGINSATRQAAPERIGGVRPPRASTRPCAAR